MRDAQPTLRSGAQASRCASNRAAVRRAAFVWWNAAGGFLLILLLPLMDESPVQGDGGPQTESPPADVRPSKPAREEFPEYITGDECLFCHRKKIGPTWQRNPHQQTIRPALPSDPAMIALAQLDTDVDQNEVKYLLGSRRLVRFLKRSATYGKFELLSAVYRPDGESGGDAGRMQQIDSPHWDTTTFADRCAGCHTTAVDRASGAFSAVSLDCVTCHGEVDLNHTQDPGSVFLSATNRDPHQVISACSQCHLRGGRSETTGRPYPDTFVAGDDLFGDFQVDLSDEHIRSLPVMQQHIYRNARNVVRDGTTGVTCLHCHDVHGRSSERHIELPWSPLCASCHDPDAENHDLRPEVRPANHLANGSPV